jgi:hypothetical protein
VAARADRFIGRVHEIGGDVGVLQRPCHPDDRDPLVRPTPGNGTDFLLRACQRGSARV